MKYCTQKRKCYEYTDADEWTYYANLPAVLCVTSENSWVIYGKGVFSNISYFYVMCKF